MKPIGNINIGNDIAYADDVDSFDKIVFIITEGLSYQYAALV